MNAITLHYSPTDASLAPHLFLEELGVPYRLALVDRSVQAQKSPAYLQLNPNGLIPVLVDGDAVLYETAAILLHLGDRYGLGPWVPALGSDARAQFYKWLVWTSATLHAALIPFFYGDRFVDPGNTDGARQVAAQSEARVGGLLEQVEAQLASHDGPWFFGEAFCAVDCYLLMLGGWTRRFARPASTRPGLGDYLRRVAQRPAARRVCAQEGIDPTAWWGHAPNGTRQDPGRPRS